MKHKSRAQFRDDDGEWYLMYNADGTRTERYDAFWRRVVMKHKEVN